jgi:hypothetical protein
LVRSVVFLLSVDYSYSAFLSVFIISSLQSTRAISLINSPIILGWWITYPSECKPSHQYLLVCHLEEDWLLFIILCQSCCQKFNPEYTFQHPVLLKAKKSMPTLSKLKTFFFLKIILTFQLGIIFLYYNLNQTKSLHHAFFLF